MTRVVVVGAGVVGLSCAVRLAEAGYDAHVLARDLPAETTSAVAGALWLPYRANPPGRIAAWAHRTFTELVDIVDRDQRAGILLRDGVLLHRGDPPRPAWADAVLGLVELQAVTDPAPGYSGGWGLRVPLVDMALYLPWLVARLASAGGTVTRMSLPALPNRGVVVDATGVGARAMAHDDTVHPVRGQVVVVENPGLTRWLVDDTERDGELTYVLPRTDTVVLGGTAVEGGWDHAPDPLVAMRILERTTALVPALRGARVLRHRVGLRPGRPAVRLETDCVGEADVVHCYGHGGSGVTLSWGCADDVLAEVSRLTPA